MLNEAICDALLRELGSTHYVAVVKWSNSRGLRKELTLPSALLAAQRFQAAALSSRSDWVSAGPLSGSHIALIIPESRSEIDWSLDEALDRFSFIDPQPTGGAVVLVATKVLVCLQDFRSLKNLFLAVNDLLLKSESGRVDPDPNRHDRWCTSLR